MAQSFCEVCAAEVTVARGRCLVGHTIDHPLRPSRPGRHRARGPATAARPIRRLSSLPSVRLASPGRRKPLSVLEVLGLGEPVELALRSAPALESTASRPSAGRTAVETWGRLADVTAEGEDEVDTGKLIGRLWEASNAREAAAEPAWTPEELPPLPGSPRSFRWSVVLLVGLLVAGLAALGIIATQVPSRQAQQVAGRYRASLESLAQALPIASQTAGTITDPLTPTDRLSLEVVPIAQLEGRALELATVTAQPLPQPPPLTFGDPVRSLAPVRRQLQQIAEQAQRVNDRLDLVLQYRLLLARAFQLPPLPLSASSEEVGQLSVDLAVAVADTIDVLSQLPEDPAFSGHRREAEALVRRLDVWQAEYLDALRREDVDRSTELVAEIEAELASIHDLGGPLGTLQGWSEAELAELGRLLDEGSSALDGPPGGSTGG